MQPKPSDPVEKRQPWKRWALLATLLVFGLGLFGLAKGLQSRPMVAGDWITAQVEQQVNGFLPEGRITFRSIEVGLSDGYRPQIYLDDLNFYDRDDQLLADLRRLQGDIALTPLFEGAVELRRLTASGLVLRLDRRSDGSFDLGFGTTTGAPTTSEPVGGAVTFANLLSDIDHFFEGEAVSKIEDIAVEAVTINYTDAMTGQVWTGDGGNLRFAQDTDRLLMTSDVAVLTGRQDLAALSVTYVRDKSSGNTDLTAIIEDAQAVDIASQAPALAWLGVVEASLSGSLRAQVLPDRLGPLFASLELGEGVVQPTANTRPVRFSEAKLVLEFDPDAQRLNFEQVLVDSAWGRVQTSGAALLTAFDGAVPSEVLGQFQVSEFAVNPAGLYDQPLSVDSGSLEFRLRLNPFEIDIGQLSIRDGTTTAMVSGTIAGRSQGWDVAVDAQVDHMTPAQLMGYWPPQVTPGVRGWFDRNLIAGDLRDVAAVLRMPEGGGTELALTHFFDQGTVRVMPNLPPVENARGAVQLAKNSAVVLIDSGQMTAPQGGVLKTRDSQFIIADMGRRPVNLGQLTLNTSGPITAALSVLDQKPFEFMQKAGQPVDLAKGTADLRVQATFPLGTSDDRVSFNASGVLRDVDSSVLIPDRRLVANRLDLQVTPKLIEISGAATLDDVPFTGTWSQPLGETAASVVAGVVDITPQTLATFGVSLPDGAVRGSGKGDLKVTLPPGEPIKFELASDLRGLTVAVDAVGWTKPAGARGDFSVAGTLSANPKIDAIALSAPGFSARGKVNLGQGGAFEGLELSQVKVGDWFDAPVTLTNRGAGRAPAVAVAGGRLDLRRSTFAGSGGGEGPPITARLARLQVTKDIAVTDLVADLTSASGLKGAFRGRINGGMPIRGTLTPSRHGPVVEVEGDNAGAIIRDAGFLDNIRNGQIKLTLIPRAQEGSYDGTLALRNIRVKDMPAMAELIDAISVVGLLQQMDGQGLSFPEADARFRLTPAQVIVSESSAVGPSLGVSLDGIYSFGSNQMDFQGVVSPFYLLNGIGSIFTRRGEGLVGFNFNLRGALGQPKVAVNPFSVLTPAMFREIFRRPAPKLDQ